MSDDSLPLIINLRDEESGQMLIEHTISIDDLKTNKIEQNTELMIRGRDKNAGLNVALSYEQNEVLKWVQEVEIWDSEIRNDVAVF